VKESRINRHYLIDSILHKDAQYWSEWQQVKQTRELDWVVGPRLQSHLERIDFLEAQFSDNRQSSVLIVSEVVDRIISLTEWVTSIRALGLLSDRILPTTPTVQSEVWNSPSSDSDISTGVNGQILPAALWADAMTMFSSPHEIAAPYPLPQEVNIHTLNFLLRSLFGLFVWTVRLY
jgi:hypothetical protein